MASILLSGSVAACGAILGSDDLEFDAASGDGGVPDGFVPTSTKAVLFLGREAIDFGTIHCGQGADDIKLEIANNGGSALEWTAALAENPAFLLRGTSTGTLGPGGHGEIDIGALPIPAADEPGAAKQTVLTITSNDPTRPSVELPVTITTGGGALDIVPSDLSFGESTVNVSAAPVDVVLRNTGNEAITVALAQPADAQYSLAWTGAPDPVTLGPGEAMPGLRGSYKPSALGTTTTSSAISIAGAMCGSAPSVLTLTGTGTNSKASVQPLLLDFGKVPCGTAAASKVVSIGNTAVAPFTFDAVLGNGAASQFTLSPSSGGVAGNGSTALTVVPKTIPTNDGIADNRYGDTIDITTTSPGDSVHTVTLRMSAQGVILTANRTAVDFGNVNAGNTKTLNLVVGNNGNQTAGAVLTVSGSTVFSVSPGSSNIGAGSSGTFGVKCNASGSGVKTGNLKITVAQPLCMPLPATIPLTCNVK